LEVFGYQEIRNIVFRLKSNRGEIDAVVNGEKLPTTELLLGIHLATGVSIDWLLTGEGNRLVTYGNQYKPAETRPRGRSVTTGTPSILLATPVQPAQGS
jgi:phage repressor protein C with HTH and peptisase S24 domain